MPRPQVFTQKDNQQRIKLQKTPRDGAEYGGVKADAQVTDGQITQRHHLALAEHWSVGRIQQVGGAGVRMVEEIIEMKGLLYGRTLGTTGT